MDIAHCTAMAEVESVPDAAVLSEVREVNVDLESLIHLSLSFDPLKLLLQQLMQRSVATQTTLHKVLGVH